MAERRTIEILFKSKGDRDIKAAERELVKLRTTALRSEKALNRMNKSAKSAGGAFKLLGGVIAGAGVARAFRSIIDATIEQERVVTQLNAALESTGGTVGLTSQQLQTYAAELQQVTTYGDEAVISAQAMLLTFTNIQGVNFNRTTQAVLDLSTAMNQDLKTSSIQLGKALNDPVANLGALSRTGIQFTKDQKEVIKSLAETGRVAEAQTIILEELERQFGGSAEAARGTLGGALDSLKNAFGDLLEGDGDGLNATVDSLNRLTETLNSPGVKGGFENVTSGVLGIVNGLVRATAALGNFGNFLGEFIAQSAGVTAIDDMPAKIRAINEELANRNAGILRQFSRKVGFLGWSDDELRAEAERLQGLFDAYNNLRNIQLPGLAAAGGASAPAPTAAAPTAAAPIAAAPTATDGGGDWLSDLTGGGSFTDWINGDGAPNEATIDRWIAYADAVGNVEEPLQKTADASKQLTDLGGEAFAIFDSSFESMVQGVASGTQSISDGFKDMVKAIIAQLVRLMAYRAVFSLLGFDPAMQASFGQLAGITQAKGGAWENGVQKFAQGGVVGGPTLFNTRGGLGMMGEKGPEAIMPLSRAADGSLGVGAQPVNITINNQAPGTDVQARQTDDGLVIDVVTRAIADQIRAGGSLVSSAIEQSYGVNRGAAAY